MREVIYLGTPEAEESDQHILREFGALGNTCRDLHYPPLNVIVRLLSPVRTCEQYGEGVIQEEGWDAKLGADDYIFSEVVHRSVHGKKFLKGIRLSDNKTVCFCIGQPENITIDWRDTRAI